MKSWSKLVLCCCLILTIATISVPVHAGQAEDYKKEIMQVRFTYINVFQNTFVISGNGKASVTVYLNAHSVDQVKVSAYLQQFKDGRWKTIKSWSNIRDGISCGLGKNWYVVSGYHYRMVSFGYVYKNNILLESTSYVSGAKFY